jgi:transposase
MYLHANAKLGLAGRLSLVRAIEEGMTLKAAAVAFSVSPATAHRWWHRWVDGERRPEALRDRSSRPHHSPRLLARELQERICDCRRKTGWGPRLVAGVTGFAHSTVWKVLKRAGLSRRAAAVKEPANSYEWPCPGDLLHMDVSRYARFLRPGHRVTGDRSQRSRNWMRPETRVGYDYAHAIVDDHSRLAFVELHPDENAATVTGFVERALVFFAQHGITAKRLMTDNSFSYVRNRSLRESLARHGIRRFRGLRGRLRGLDRCPRRDRPGPVRDRPDGATRPNRARLQGHRQGKPRLLHHHPRQIRPARRRDGAAEVRLPLPHRRARRQRHDAAVHRHGLTTANTQLSPTPASIGDSPARSNSTGSWSARRAAVAVAFLPEGDSGGAGEDRG